MTKDNSGQVRHFPGPHGDFISPNYDLGSGPYSQNNGKPYGGVSAKSFIDKKRRLKKKKSKSLLDTCNLFHKLAMDKQNEFTKTCLDLLDKSSDTFIFLFMEAIRNKNEKIKREEFVKNRFVLKLSDTSNFYSGVDIQDERDILMVLTFRPGTELSMNVTKEGNKVKVSIKMTELTLLAKMSSPHNLKKLVSDMFAKVSTFKDLFLSSIA